MNKKKIIIILLLLIMFAVVALFLCLHLNKNPQIENKDNVIEKTNLVASIKDDLKREELERVESLAFTKARNISVIMSNGKVKNFTFGSSRWTDADTFEQEVFIDDELAYTSFSLDGTQIYMVKDAEGKILYDLGMCLYYLSDLNYQVLEDDGEKMLVMISSSPFVYKVEYNEIMSEKCVTDVSRVEE